MKDLLATMASRIATRRIRDVAPVQTGFAFKSGWFVESGVRLLRNTNIHQGFVDWDDTVVIDRDWLSRFQAFSLNEGDIVLTLDRPIVASGLKVARMATDDLPALINQRVARFKLDPEHLDADYFYAFLRSPRFIDSIRGHDQSLGVPHISPAQVERVDVPLPPLSVQRSIAEALNRAFAEVDTAQRAAEDRLAAAQALPAAYLREIFEGPEASKWKMRRFSLVLRETRNGLYKHERFYGDGVSIVKMFNIGRFDGRWHLDRLDLVRLNPAEHEQYRLAKGDILINRVNSRELVGKCAVIDSRLEGAVFESKNIRARVAADADPNFVAYWFNSRYARDQIESRIKQIVGQATLNGEDLRGLEMPFPSHSDQHQIAARISRVLGAAESLIARCRAELAAIEALPASLLRAAFNGDS